jgi:hypothetical protein
MSLKIAILLAGIVSVHAQGKFQDLNFESANLTPVPPNYGPIVYVPTTSALPGWTAYLGATSQSQVIQNSYGEGEAEIDIFGPNYPAAGPSFSGVNPGVIDGNYSVLLQAGAQPPNLVSASIAQTGTVPLTAESLQFKAWQTFFTQFTVSFDGNTLAPVALGTGANYTLYGVDIAPYAGKTGPLEFTADFVTPGASWLGLDDITFSTTAVPEPSPAVLAGVGGLMFAAYRRLIKRQ